MPWRIVTGAAIIGAGRASRIYDLGDGTVLRRPNGPEVRRTVPGTVA
jgi:hypothetical protein